MTTKRILTALLLVAIALYTQWLTEPDGLHNDPVLTATPRPAPDGSVRIARVVDGDTIELEGGTRVRFIGINTPETVDPRTTVQCFGKEASDYNKELLQDGVVVLKKDISETDKYGRLLRYVYLPDGTFVNLKLVEEGYAYASTYPPDIAHAKEFAAAQTSAREAGRGLWGACPAKK
jgi:micrococcal nuclease